MSMYYNCSLKKKRTIYDSYSVEISSPIAWIKYLYSTVDEVELLLPMFILNTSKFFNNICWRKKKLNYLKDI